MNRIVKTVPWGGLNVHRRSRVFRGSHRRCCEWLCHRLL